MISNEDQPWRDLIKIGEILKKALEKVKRNTLEPRFIIDLVNVCKTWSCSTESEIPFAKIMIQLTLKSLVGGGESFSKFTLSFCMDIVAIMGRIDDSEDLTAQNNLFKIVNSRSLDVSLASIFESMKNQMDESNWLIEISNIIICPSSTTQGSLILTFLCERLYWIAEACATLAQAVMCGKNYGNFVSLLEYLFKTVSSVAKLMALHKLSLDEPFIKLVTIISGGLTRNIYLMLPAIQQKELEQFRELSEQKKKKSLTKKIKILISKESRSIPRLIFQIEEFERSILALNNIHKTVIVKTFHRSTARDFRIQLDELNSVLNQSEPDQTTSSKDSTLRVEEDPDATNIGKTNDDNSHNISQTSISLVISNGTLQ